MVSTGTFFSVRNVPGDDVFLNSAARNTLQNSEMRHIFLCGGMLWRGAMLCRDMGI